MSDDYIEPPVEFSKRDWLLVGIALVFIYFEFKYMDVWCKWFTNC
jgi:hypothetical protein